MNSPQESSHTQNYRELLEQNVARGMDRDLADVKARQALGRKMTERDKAILARNAGTPAKAEDLGAKVREAEDARKRVKDTVRTEALAVAESIPRGLALDAHHLSNILVKNFGTNVQLSDRELELLVRDYEKNKDAIKASREWLH